VRGLIAFDLDGTLVDTPRAITDCFQAVLASLGAGAREASAIRAKVGQPLEQAFFGLLGDRERAALAALRYQALFRERVLPRAAELVFPGADAGLERLRSEGFGLAVITSKVTASAEALLRAAGLRRHFGLVVGADQTARQKPDPEPAFLALRALDVRARDAVMVGDTTHDVLMARAAGMEAVAVTYGAHDRAQLLLAGADRLAGTFDEAVGCLLRESVR
jgi:phosphoglycolate phosphatase